MVKNRRKLLAVLGLASALALGMVMVPRGEAQAVRGDGTLMVFTAPSERVDRHFFTGGIIRNVPVKEGQVVKKGEILMEQDDEIEQAELERLTEEATKEYRIQYYQAAVNVAKKKLERMETAIAKAIATGGVTAFADAELEQARAELDQAQRQIEVSTLDHQGDINKARQQKLKVDRMRIKADWDGVVEKIGTRTGELATPDKDKPSITLVKNDPCYVVINKLTTAQVSKIKQGDEFEVKYPDEDQWRQAKVSFIAPVADVGANTQMIRLELPNPENRSTGLPIQLKLPGKLTTTAVGNAASAR